MGALDPEITFDQWLRQGLEWLGQGMILLWCVIIPLILLLVIVESVSRNMQRDKEREEERKKNGDRRDGGP